MVFERFTKSIKLLKESWGVLKKDKELLLYPFISAAISLIVLAAIFIPTIFAVLSGSIGFGAFFLAFIIFYFIAAIIGTFFTASLMAAAHMRLHGKDPKFSDGIRIASKSFGKLLGWSLINATVGLILSMISGRDDIISKVISYILSLAWAFLTLFTIPVILFEKSGVLGSIKRSGQIFVKTWGESVVGQFSIGLMFGISFLIGFLAILGALFTGSFILFAIVFVIVLVFLIVVYLVTSALNGIYITALYIYATQKKVPKGFSKEFIESAFVEKKGKISRGFV